MEKTEAAANADSAMDTSETIFKDAAESEPKIALTILHGKNKHAIEIGPSQSILELKEQVFKLSNVPTSMQKLLCKGKRLEDVSKVSDTNLKNKAKVMLIGNALETILVANKPPDAKDQAAVKNDMQQTVAEREPLCKTKPHCDRIKDGPPAGAPPGLKGTHLEIPEGGLTKLIGHTGKPVRMTFKPDLQQLWLATSEHTQKLPYAQIRDVNKEENIEGHEGYSIVSLQLGSGEKSKMYFYFFPDQYISSMRTKLLGGW